jgi:hypothetical protein
LINAFSQVLIFRTKPSFGLLKSEYVGFASGLIMLALLHAYSFTQYLQPLEDIPLILLANLLIYGALGYCYFHFINLCLTARRIRLVRDLYKSVNGLSITEILEGYNAKIMVQIRLKRLLDSGQIVFVDGKYHIGKPIILFAATCMVALKKLFLGKRSEYD